MRKCSHLFSSRRRSRFIGIIPACLHAILLGVIGNPVRNLQWSSLEWINNYIIFSVPGYGFFIRGAILSCQPPIWHPCSSICRFQSSFKYGTIISSINNDPRSFFKLRITIWEERIKKKKTKKTSRFIQRGVKQFCLIRVFQQPRPLGLGIRIRENRAKAHNFHG